MELNETVTIDSVKYIVKSISKNGWVTLETSDGLVKKVRQTKKGQKESLKEEKKSSCPFKYTKSLEKEDKHKLENLVWGIKFSISRYSGHKHFIKFDEQMTVKKAIREAEKFLSVSISKEYFDKYNQDYFDNFEELESDGNRGDLLGSAIFIESIDFFDKDDKTYCEFRCGS
jgi:hypothetical protein